VEQRGNELVRQKIHPTSIISGYRLARKEAVKYIKVSVIAGRVCVCCAPHHAVPFIHQGLLADSYGQDGA
jgi:hypothetical protein